MIEPTIGRIVWFHPHPDAPNQKLSGQPHAAKIAHVNADGTINLGCLNSLGLPYAATNVRLIQEGQVAPIAAAYAEWMPYQKGQAAKTEQLQSQVETAKTATATGAAPAAPAQAPTATTTAPAPTATPEPVAPTPGPSAAPTEATAAAAGTAT